jgi:laminin B (domain IV)
MSRTTTALVATLAICCTGCARTQAGHELLVHDFSRSAEGWLVAGDTGPIGPIFHPTGGRSGGYISNTDEAVGETWYFQAPASVLTQLAAAEGGRLEYSLKQDSADTGFPDDDVVIVGQAGRLSYRFDYAPGTEWTDFSVPLSTSAHWRWNWNAPATEEQIRSVLGRPSRLEIRGEYRTGDDVGAMDRFALMSGH